MNIRELKGIGEKTEKLFEKINIRNTDELVNYYPRSYDVYTEPMNISQINNCVSIPSVEGVIVSGITMKNFRNLSVLNVTIKDKNGDKLKITWFNMPYLKSKLKIGYRYIFRGQIKKDLSGKNPVMEQPTIFTLGEYEKKQGTLQPVYHLVSGLTNNIVRKSIIQVLEYKNLNGGFDEYLPDIILRKANLMDYKEAINAIHFPDNTNVMMDARKRLIFDEFFMFIMALKSFKDRDAFVINSFKISRSDRADSLINSLPYKLTDAQNKVIKEIRQDMVSNKVMNRLVQGDVGCGKTIIAFIALIDTVSAGYQGALMAPTEVLAKQHYEKISELNARYNLKINPVLLVGSMTVKEKNIVYDKIKSGEADIIIGTHALIQDKVEYKNLALVITDEQHRFGVLQREKLSEKGKMPHILVMSATPIPRTLAIILYGDLDISIVDTMPSNRLPVKNCVVGHDYRRKAYKFIENQVKNGRQAYVICPMVEANDDCESGSKLCDVISYTEILRKELDENIKIAYLHGKMKPMEKNQIMESFARNEIQVLVSTTVIEVGVDVQNATVMMIEDSERFGLASLHQLRGRVGRGGHQSYCIFVYGNDKPETMERLDILNHSNDGFEIANWDLKLRGPGDFFGIRQSGEMDFKIGDIFADADTLKNAADSVRYIEENMDTLRKEEKKKLNDRLNSYIKNQFKLNL